MPTSIDEVKLKELLKVVVLEALHEHRDLFKDIVEEAIEEMGLIRAIDEGLSSKSVPREEVLAILEDGR